MPVKIANKAKLVAMLNKALGWEPRYSNYREGYAAILGEQA